MKKVEVVTVVLGTGGPHTEIEAELDDDGDIASAWLVGYWAADTVKRRICTGESIYRALQHYVESSFG